MAGLTLVWIGLAFDSREKTRFRSVLFCLFGSGCSFHSNQLEALKTIFREDSGPDAAVGVFLGGSHRKSLCGQRGLFDLFCEFRWHSRALQWSFRRKNRRSEAQLQMSMDISITKTKLDESEVFSYRGATSDLGDLLCESPKETINDLALEVGSMRLLRLRKNASSMIEW